MGIITLWPICLFQDEDSLNTNSSRGKIPMTTGLFPWTNKEVIARLQLVFGNPLLDCGDSPIYKEAGTKFQEKLRSALF